jgi:ATP-dependent exoDNAse (exonuclease V) beta subunit
MVEREEGDHRLQCVASLTFPGEVLAEKLAERVPEPQLTLALDAAAPLPIAPSPDQAPPAIATVSFSSLSNYVQCSYRYYLARILGLPEQEPPAEHDGAEAIEYEGLDPRVRGNIAHRLLEDLTPAAVTTDDVLQMAQELGAEPTEDEIADLLGLAQAFGRSPLAARLAAATAVHREHPFAFTLDPEDPAGPLVNGFVDVIAREADGGLLVVDYKTNRVGDADLEAIVQDEYGLQRSIYALAALLSGAPRVDVAYCFLERPAEPVVSSHDRQDIAVLLAEVQDRAAGLRRGDFPVAANPHRDLCLTCPGRGGLCSWPQERVLQPLAGQPGEG